mmetsp:Transcript_38056/g.68773  ORF Transcript_38056/g.68773 Transcript_38056/m.68773 type:complete len:353 (+) Transcript_38056:57-1115(+)
MLAVQLVKLATAFFAKEVVTESLDFAEAEFSEGDECQDGESCSLYALQSHARKTTEDTNISVVPDLKKYDINLSELGRDELLRLVEEAQAELTKRDQQDMGAGACHTALHGERCYDAVQWAKKDGIYGHPDWYPGLSSSSSFEAFQAVLASKGKSGCQMPCGTAVRHQAMKKQLASSQGAGSCGFRQFTGGPGSSLCFCQLAGNPGCANQPCACPQGCGDGVTWHSATTVTFKNKARAYGCHPSTVLLTSPKSYFGTPADLKGCGSGALGVIEALLTDSWNMYQTHVGTGSLNQCFHGSHTASVRYLHMQTFCSYASFHAMPNGNHAVGSCVQMHSLDEVPVLAKKLFNMMQ